MGQYLVLENTVKKWTIEEDNFMRNNIDIYTIKEIAELLGRTYNAVKLRMHKIGIKCKKRQRKYPINENYFNNMSSNVAYIIGHAMADASVRITNDNKFQLRYGISKKDIEILQFIISEIGPSLKIREYRDNEISLEINSKVIFNSLNNYGIIPNKTGKETLKNIPRHYFYDYLRGLFDGDGTIYFSKKMFSGYDYGWKIYCSNFDYLKQLRDYEGNNLGYLRQIGKRDNFYCWDIKKIKDILYLKNKLYNGTFCLQRKRDKFDMIENYYMERKHG